jgi:hypothetical protein
MSRARSIATSDRAGSAFRGRAAARPWAFRPAPSAWRRRLASRGELWCEPRAAIDTETAAIENILGVYLVKILSLLVSMQPKMIRCPMSRRHWPN